MPLGPNLIQEVYITVQYLRVQDQLGLLVLGIDLLRLIVKVPTIQDLVKGKPNAIIKTL